MSRRAIVDAALEIAQKSGIEAVTMRRVAEALDTAAGSLYVYVENRSELIAYMLDAAYGDIDLEVDASLSWDDVAVEIINRQISGIAKYPGLALQLAGTIPVGDQALRVNERVLAHLIDGGIEPARAAWGVDLLGLYVMAAAVERAAYSVRAADEGLIERDYIEGARERYSELDPSVYPVTSAMAAMLVEGSGDDRQEWAVRVLIEGIRKTPTGKD